MSFDNRYNSRTQILAAYYDIPNVRSASAGTEVTAFHPNTLIPLREAGMEIFTDDASAANPMYTLSYDLGDGKKGQILGFSKLVSHESNPKKGFCAVMTCGSADRGCPVVFGASKRLALPFVDPKGKDGTAEQDEAYRNTSMEIALEIAFALQQVMDS